MKRTICLLLVMLSFSLCFAQQKIARVTLKSGVTITGTVIELNPTSHLVIQVAGVNSRIEMGDVASIEDIASETTETNTNPTKVSNAGPVVLDQGSYPASYILKVGPYDIEMVLVRGALFDMGYDGKGSLKKNSEPVHKVQLSSYYINKTPLSKDLVAYLKKGAENHSDKVRSYSPSNAKDALSIAEKLASSTKLPIDLITEAQCEYALISGITDALEMAEKYEMIWCKDFFADYSRTAQPQVDPIGPRDGRNHVMRNFAAKNDDVYNRYTVNPYSNGASSIRVSILASKLIL